MSIGHPYFNRDVGNLNPLVDSPHSACSQMVWTNQQLGNQMAAQQNNYPYGQQAQQMGMANMYAQSTVKPPEKKSMFKEITTDIRGFLLEHRGVIYFIAFALILDHFIFRGAFKARLQSMADKVVTKVEEKIK